MAKRPESFSDQTCAKQPKLDNDDEEPDVWEEFLASLKKPETVAKAKESPDYFNYMERDRSRFAWQPSKEIMDFLFKNLQTPRAKPFDRKKIVIDIICPTMWNFIKAPLTMINDQEGLLAFEKLVAEKRECYVVQSVRDTQKPRAVPKLVLMHSVYTKQSYILDLGRIGRSAEPALLRLFTVGSLAFFESLKEANELFQAWGFGFQNCLFVDVILGPEIVAMLPEMHQLYAATGYELDNSADIVATFTKNMSKEVSLGFWRMAMQIQLWAVIAIHEAGKAEQFGEKCRIAFSTPAEVKHSYCKAEFYNDEGFNCVKPKYTKGEGVSRW